MEAATHKLVGLIVIGEVQADEHFLAKLNLPENEKHILRTVQRLYDDKQRISDAYEDLRLESMRAKDAELQGDPDKLIKTKVEGGKLRRDKEDIAS